ncbi:amino acid ABC transporter permease [Ancylobacter mangrovi]|uniref:Amino acid ABC transporter permease n=1 Tax=Ancylobacter mangrovi TaxID=2972472 RepID=A0A9X2P9D9_9HYPH|nr:amino acid ABC transporter permease [Ancylobacter mangrovi]MCS0494456.1 amino acid ABC transporter permease [Ancylobacter mangrovi]MCS0500838.1 amino acid ABC transporter permease [Ancylobacter mangrovi]
MHETYGLLEYMPSVFRALGLTIWLSWLSLIIGAVGGLVLALMRTSGWRVLSVPALLYVEIFRSIPILIILFFFFYGAPLVLGINVSAFAAATAALSAHASALMTEVIRAGIESVGRGQWEAAQSSGMTYGQVMRHVVGPQSMQVILPPSVNIYIMILKESSIASIIGYVELTATGLLIREAHGGGFAILGIIAILYFIVCYAISLAGGALERRMKIAGSGLHMDGTR